MHLQNVTRLALALGLTSVLVGLRRRRMVWRPGHAIPTEAQLTQKQRADAQRARIEEVSNADYEYGESDGDSSVFDLFSGGDDPNTTVEVNKYLWQAALDVLNFLPIESVDPFTGVIVTGYGTPAGRRPRLSRHDLCAGPGAGCAQPEGGAAVAGRRRGFAGNRARGRGCDPDPGAAVADSDSKL